MNDSFSSRSPLHLTRNAETERLQRENSILKEENVSIDAVLGLQGEYDGRVMALLVYRFTSWRSCRP
jgi:hypothetical protein